MEQILEERPNIILFMTPDISKINEFEEKLQLIRKENRANALKYLKKAHKSKISTAKNKFFIHKNNNCIEKDKIPSKFSKTQGRMTYNLFTGEKVILNIQYIEI